MDRRAALVAPSNPTCVPCNGGTPSTLDLVLTNSHKCITDMRTVTEGGSDHLPVLFNIWGRAEANEKRPIFNFAQTDWDLFRWSLDLNIPTASPPLDTPSRIEAAVESLTREINEAIRISTPIKSQLPPRVELPREIVELIKLKNAVRRRWQSQRSGEYKKMMNQLQRTVRDKIAEWKTERWNKMLRNTTTRDNTFWNLLRRFNRQCGRTNPTFRDGSEVASTNPEKATLLAKYFSANNQSTTRGNRSFVERVDAQVRRMLTAPPESYLSDRNIRVRIGESLSEEVSLQAGLPQGSVLSPWLFNIYTAHVLRSTYYTWCVYSGFRRRYSAIHLEYIYIEGN
ncbi:hypothetical protein AAG570_012751 [Ranatra chinensis]|uniref:Reverse transcriptase domain-containing protein n=1 Tax=Ranatra chinensis TaxID=642074 RepID=A0ABD0YR78_9HEMI